MLSSGEAEVERMAISPKDIGTGVGAFAGYLVGTAIWVSLDISAETSAPANTSSHESQSTSLPAQDQGPNELETAGIFIVPVVVLAAIGRIVAPRIRAWRWNRELNKSIKDFEAQDLPKAHSTDLNSQL